MIGYRPVATLADRFLPPTPLARRLSAQSILFAVGEGTFLTGSAVFFTQIVGLSAAQVGLGLTIAGITTFFCAVPLGRLADRIGPKRMWALGALGEALLYLAWPWINGFAAFVAMMIALELIGGAGWAGRGAYTLDIFSREERVRSLAFMRSALNIGFSLGALLGGLALATGSDAVIRAVPLLTAAILAANALLITRLPPAPHDESPAEPTSLITPGALSNKGFLALTTFDGVLGTNQVLLNVVIPLWLVAELSDPDRRGEYQGAAVLGGTLGSVWAPAAYTFLAMNWGTPGWLLIGAIVVLATIGMHPAARVAERYLQPAGSGRSDGAAGRPA